MSKEKSGDELVNLLSGLISSLSKLKEGISLMVEEQQDEQHKENLQTVGKVLSTVMDSMNSVRLVTNYVVFDLEATRRECAVLRTLLEDKRGE
ncbi:hypothetical protein LCGC14_0142740 [marine sediment metagenome]|uniref:Uncharacterized protein n=1 Tax=marine sediment metagenome TaxID=412755 RepID=A0A0F9V4W0_9ZZZZ